MKKLSTFQIVLMSIFGAFALAGFLIFAFVTTTGKSSSIGSVTIWGTLDEAEIKSVLRETADADTRFSEVNYVYKDPSTYDAELKDALASGRGPDLFMVRDDEAIQNESLTYPVPYAQFSEAQFRSTFLDASEPFLGSEGIIAVPLFFDPLVLYWNKDALATAGISEPPKYWDQLPAMVQLLVKKGDSGTIEKGGIALGTYDNIPEAKDIFATMIMQAGGTITGRDKSGILRPLLSAQGSATAAETALSFYTEFANPAQDDYSWSRAFRDARGAFASGDVAMYVGRASEASRINAANPNLNFSMSALPQIRSATYALGNSRVYGLALARTSRNAQNALTIAFALAGADMATPLAKKLNMVSALRRATVTATGGTGGSQNDLQKAFQNLVAGATPSTEALVAYQANISKAWLDPNSGETSKIFRAMIEDTVSGAVKIAEAVQRADKQIAEISSR